MEINSEQEAANDPTFSFRETPTKQKEKEETEELEVTED